MKKTLIALPLCLIFFANAFAFDLVNRAHREKFSSPEVNQNFRQTQVDTVNFFNRQTSEVNGLIESFRGTSNLRFDLRSRTFILGNRGKLDLESFTYDGAIAALAYLVAGQPRRAANLLRVYRREFNTLKGGRKGLFNAYRTDRAPTRTGIPAGMDGDRMHLGPNTWMGVAALQYTAITGRTEFLQFAVDIAIWSSNLTRHVFPDGSLGASSMGFGWSPPDWTITFSTENVVDHYALLKMLRELYLYANPSANVRRIMNDRNFGLAKIEADMHAIERWMMEIVWCAEKGAFNVGVNEFGLDTTDALDVVSWTIPAMTPQRLVELGVCPIHMMDFANEHFFVADIIEGERIYGFDFTNFAGRRRNYVLVWFEGTGFHSVAAQVMSRWARSIGDEYNAERFREYSVFLNDQIFRAAATIGMQHNALPYTSKNPRERQIFTTFADAWEIPRGRGGQWVASSSSTGWRMLAFGAFDPLGFDRENIDYRIFRR
ncbi:MAG: hypothetical protein FWC85_00320 [Elusimicrobia bacterium]|nr:hypothetical protein [Elusimicrobiota bacterium]